MGGWGAQSRPETFGIDACAYWDYDACCGGSSNSTGARGHGQSTREPRNNPSTRRHPSQVPEPSSVGPGPKIMKKIGKSSTINFRPDKIHVSGVFGMPFDDIVLRDLYAS